MVKTLPKASSADTLSSVSAQDYTFRDPEARPATWKRFAVGGLCLGLGLCAAGIGLTSVYYRFTHMTIKTGIVNGRTVRVQSPVDGTIQDFYSRPGISVRTGQVLARLNPLAREQGQSLVPELQRQVQAMTAELSLARQTLALLNQQQKGLEQQDQQVQQATVAVATDDRDRYQASLDAAIAEESAAQSDYSRFRSLLSEGAVSAQQVDQLEASWKAAQAKVKAARAELEASSTMLSAARTSVPMASSIDDMQERQEALAKEVQAQEAAVERLTLALGHQQAELDEAKGLNKQEAIVPVKAPFSGVVYTTYHETGEQVSRPETLLGLLDCNDLWVETLVGANRANRVDADKPVRVKLAGSDQTVLGQVTVIEAVSMGELTEARAEAILPAVPPNLINQPLARVRVTIPASENPLQAHQFCGVGQNAQLTFGMDAWSTL